MAYLLKQAWRVVTDRLTEMLVIFVLLALAGVPGLEFIVRFLLNLLGR